jgi:hypothetical protein
MALGCNCDTGLSNTGQPSCVTLQSVTSKIIQVPLIANDGTANKINLSTAITNTTFTSLVNNVDPSKRWYPLPNFENVELAKADTQFEEANSGRKAFLRQGIRSFAGELWATTGTPQFLGKLQGDRCVKFGIYIVDVNGNLIGSKVGNDLYPITVDNNSWDPKFMFATDTTINKIMLGFDFDRLFDESTMWMITASEGLIDFNSLNGLLDVNFSTPTQVSTISINFNAFLSYGTAINPLKYVGALTGDWQMTNMTTGLVVVGTVTETATAGNYTGLFTMVVGNKYRLRVLKTGFTGDLLFTAI